MNISYQLFKNGQEAIVSDLVWEVFSEFEAPDYSAEGVDTFKAFINPEKLADQIKNYGFKVYCCFEANVLVGVIAFRDISHISLLFVKKSHHKNGIAKGLLERAVKELLREKPDLDKITVNSSPFAVKIYEKLGFKAIDTMLEKDGIKYTPMSKSLYS
jgi:GNAT superfamily N-acetyltransferase